VVLVLVDLDWADQPSLALLRRVVRASAEGRLSILGTYRDADLHRGHPLTAVLADLRREYGLERIVLSGWSEEEIVAGRGDARGPVWRGSGCPDRRAGYMRPSSVRRRVWRGATRGVV
jgi:hypothetical protein